jgi:hypothetical protein
MPAPSNAGRTASNAHRIDPRIGSFGTLRSCDGRLQVRRHNQRAKEHKSFLIIPRMLAIKGQEIVRVELG